MATLLKTDGTKVQVSPKNKRFTLKELYELIGILLSALAQAKRVKV